MEHVWHRHYPPHVGTEIDADAWPSLPALMDDCIEQYAGRCAFSSFGTRLGYTGFRTLADAFAAFLQNELHLGKGERIAIMLPNLLQYPVAIYGALQAGLVIVNVNPLYSGRELKHQLQDSGAETLLLLAGVTPTLGEIAAEVKLRNVMVTQLGDLAPGPLPVTEPDPRIGAFTRFTDALDRGAAGRVQRPALAGSDIAFLQYTGGTTGLSKGAVLTHRNMVANILQTNCFFSDLHEGEGEIYITALPLYHIFALTVNCLGCLHIGGLNVLITNPRDMPGFVRELGNWRFNLISGVNTLYNGLLNTPGFGQLDFSGLRKTVAGGMALQMPVAQRWREVTGCRVQQGYGLSETSPVLTATPTGIDGKEDTIGIPVPSTELRVLDDDGNPLPPGQPGEICARGPQVMPGYWQRPDETAHVMTADGFFRTGDIGYMDDNGFFRIVDRKKDMILVSGFNVYPNEVEEVAAAMPAVLECACIGMRDEECGESVRLFVVPRPGTTPDAEAIRGFCRQQLAPYKVPRQVTFVEELPKTNVGKILRRELRDRYL